jgi:hypothetical protein
MKKNAINWKRTWKGSLFELLMPPLLMLLMVWIRTLVIVEMSDEMDLTVLKSAMYSVGVQDSVTGNWSIPDKSVRDKGAALYDFMAYTDYKPGVNTTRGTYNPVADIYSPYNFIPKHCDPSKPG